MSKVRFDVVLINPGGSQRIYQSLGDEYTAIEPPLWCRLIAGYCIDRSLLVDIIDAEAEGLTPREVAERVDASLVVLVVYGHQPSASTQQMVNAYDITVAIKDLQPSQPIMMVGGHVAALPKQTLLEQWAISYVCNSEGPVTVYQWFSKDERDVPGLVWRDKSPEDIISNTAPPLIKHLDLELHGKVWHMLPMDRYRAHNWQCFDGSPRQPYASIYTSLGCPYKCVFCCINAPFNINRYRMRSPEAVVAEVDMLAQTYNIRTFKIVDEMFVLNPRHVEDICEGLAKLPYVNELNIWAYARVDTVKDNQPSSLRSAGIRWLALGIESGSQHVRDGAEKSLDASDIFRTVRKIQDAGINVIGNFIFGLPDDTLESMWDTYCLARSLNLDFANFYSAMAYPGSRLFDETDPEDLPETWSGYSQHSYDCRPLPTKTMPSEGVLIFRDRAFSLYFNEQCYLEHIDKKFGGCVVAEIRSMTDKLLPRKLLGI